MDGSEKHAVIVAKSVKPRRFKNVKTLQFSYFANRKAWVTSQLFTDVIKVSIRDNSLAALNALEILTAYFEAKVILMAH